MIKNIDYISIYFCVFVYSLLPSLSHDHKIYYLIDLVKYIQTDIQLHSISYYGHKNIRCIPLANFKLPALMHIACESSMPVLLI